jgi:hypothetical protein
MGRLTILFPSLEDLRQEIDAGKVEAELHDGVPTIRLSKTEWRSRGKLS